jgi:hypothetical protein
METNISTTKIKELIEELLPWHQPDVQRLSVSLDTSNNLGSGPDATGHSSVGP